MKHPVFDAIEQRKRVVQIFQTVLGPWGLVDAVAAVQAGLHIEDMVIVQPTGSRELSFAILDVSGR